MKKTAKKGFTIVELVIVIAVIAILAAVLIPTFVSLVNKANSSAALADARNMANQLLINLMDKDGAESKDLIVIQEKSDGIYVHAYCTSEGKFVAYKGNPVTAAEGDDFDARVKSVLDELTKSAALLPVTIPNEDNWAHESNMKTIVETLGYNSENTAFRANYKVELVAFEKQSVSAEHTCAGNLEKRDGQTADCVHAGWSEYYICTVCGKVWNDENATETFTLTITDPTDDHDFTVPASDRVCHWNECSRCGETDIPVAHTLSHTVSGNDYTVSCSACAYKITGDAVPATYKLAIELNEKLGNTKHSTMHEAFLAVAQTRDAQGVTAVIQSISKAEGNEPATQGRIVWDQTIDRFVVTQEIDGRDAVVYTPDAVNGLSGYVEREYYLYPLWDTYDTLPDPEEQDYSIYFTGKTLEGQLYKQDGKYWNPISYSFSVGFDMGFVTYNSIDTNNVSIIQGSANGNDRMIYRTNGNGCDLYLRGKRDVEHYGEVNTLYCGVGWAKINYYEFGKLTNIANDRQIVSDVVIWNMGSSNIQILESVKKVTLGENKQN